MAKTNPFTAKAKNKKKKSRFYKITKPCANCPFRTDIPGYLTTARAQEIARDVVRTGNFACHKTANHDDETGEYDPTENESQCAGALIFQENLGQFGQLARIAMRTGNFNPDLLDMSAPVATTTQEFINHHGEEDEPDPVDCCSAVGEDCLAPAGWMEGGVIVENNDIDPDDMTYCENCGSPLCINCTCYCVETGVEE